jgi:hypothetical protein
MMVDRGWSIRQCVQWTDHATKLCAHHMGINLGCLDVLVPKQCLYHADVGAILEHMFGEGMPQYMRRNPLFNTQLIHGSRQGLVVRGFVDVMTHLLAAARVCGDVVCRKKVLPAGRSDGIRVVSGESIWQVHVAESFLNLESAVEHRISTVPHASGQGATCS